MVFGDFIDARSHPERQNREIIQMCHQIASNVSNLISSKIDKSQQWVVFEWIAVDGNQVGTVTIEDQKFRKLLQVGSRNWIQSARNHLQNFDVWEKTIDVPREVWTRVATSEFETLDVGVRLEPSIRSQVSSSNTFQVPRSSSDHQNGSARVNSLTKIKINGKPQTFIHFKITFEMHSTSGPRQKGWKKNQTQSKPFPDKKKCF